MHGPINIRFVVRYFSTFRLRPARGINRCHCPKRLGSGAVFVAKYKTKARVLVVTSEALGKKFAPSFSN